VSLKVKVLTVSDLHRGRFLYQLLERAVQKHRPEVVALVGDFLDATPGTTERLDNDEAARFLAALPCKEVVFVRGNHEDEAWSTFSEAWRRSRRRMHALHGEAFGFGPLTLLGFPCFLGEESAFLSSRLPLPVDPREWLPDVMRRHGDAARTLWLMHEPPQGTPLSEPSGPIAGNREWNDAIEAHRPLLTISGHDHVSPMANRTWFHRLGKTVCVNAGQSVVGPLHFCVVEAEFAFSLRSLPRRLTITAFPWAQALEIPTR
jgi:Icc-related predicted phosphoesterase